MTLDCSGDFPAFTFCHDCRYGPVFSAPAQPDLMSLTRSSVHSGNTRISDACSLLTRYAGDVLQEQAPMQPKYPAVVTPVRGNTAAGTIPTDRP